MVAIVIDLVLIALSVHFRSPGLIVLLVIAVLTTATHLIGKLQDWTGFGEITRETAEAMLWVEADHRGIAPKLRRVSLAFKGQAFVLSV